MKINVKRISVVIPFYNRIGLLEEAISSVLAQTYRPVEIILIDDCSTEMFSPAQIPIPDGITLHYSRNETNAGPGPSRERGMKIASGQFVHFLDSDDKIHPDFYAEAVDVLLKKPGASFVYCFTKTFDSDKINGDRIVPQEIAENILPTIYEKGRIWSTSACVWRKSITDRIGSWINGVWEDYHFDVKGGLINNEICCVPKYYCFYRVDSSFKFSEIKSFGKVLSKAKTINCMLAPSYLAGGHTSHRTALVNWLTKKFITQLKILLHLAENKHHLKEIRQLFNKNNLPKPLQKILYAIVPAPKRIQSIIVNRMN